MTIVPSHLSALYKNKLVYLWVEDEETRTYLETTWGDPDIGIYIAGGCENIGAVVQAARKDKLHHVFGYRDRDFGASNRPRWNDPSVDMFVGDAFEVENLLLDAPAMAACEVNTSPKDATTIEKEMQALAAQLDWWMACRATIVELRDVVAKDFIEHPGRSKVRSKQEALDTITTSAWWTRVPKALPAATTSPHLEARLLSHQKAYAAMLASGAWKSHVSGKEILAEMLTRIWTKKRPADPQGRQDFVKAIAQAQRKARSTPEEIVALRLALRARLGR
ncbi:hypothetical protein [Polyangium sp. y55x31]|uniref:hypothetical protein n=1 Tax=Polyangium sp. y55x31 TaxID=3042688 RepID=UPI002482DC87|nr:hypothetical protein [Polyangium sp. y55x31]MDI1475583.1 hypothetical protein [Polyangium sp. y55x31]